VADFTTQSVDDDDLDSIALNIFWQFWLFFVSLLINHKDYRTYKETLVYDTVWHENTWYALENWQEVSSVSAWDQD